MVGIAILMDSLLATSLPFSAEKEKSLVQIPVNEREF